MEWLVAVTLWSAYHVVRAPFVVSWFVYRELFRAIRRSQGRPVADSSGEREWSLPLASSAAAIISVGWFFALVVLPLHIERVQREEAEIEHRRIEGMRLRRERAEAERPDLEQRLGRAREALDAAAVLALVPSFELLSADEGERLRREARWIESAAACDPEPPRCGDVLERGRETRVDERALTAATARCRERAQARFAPPRHARSLQAEQLGELVRRSECLSALGVSTAPTVDELRALHERALKRESPPAPRRHDPGPGRGSRWDGRVARCRDSHGRFTRCR